ncbi:MAG: molybdopterin-dependent oxidoreductase [Acidobacteria bacterium]|nr:molybdopterin-dependent oxidoreductase [Acidobacteriota bacterium]
MPSSFEFQEDLFEPERRELLEGPPYRFELDRREWAALVGAGLWITAAGKTAYGQSGAAPELAAGIRLHLGQDGTITVLTGKVDVGQGSRGQIRQAAAEELRVSPEAVRVRLADTDVTPNDGSTAGSRTTPSTVPVVRRAAARAREMLLGAAAQAWGTEPSRLTVRDGAVTEPGGERRMSYADLARSPGAADVRDEGAPRQPPLTPVEQWRTLGRPEGKADGRAIVTGRHEYPSDIRRPGMLYGAVLRAPSYGARLLSVDLAPAKALGAAAVHDGELAGCAAETSYQARKALAAMAATARWEESPQPSSDELTEHLRRTAQREGSGRSGPRREERGSLEQGFAAAEKTVSASYSIPYIQHAPMEPRAAVAEWADGKLTVWTGTQRPFGVREQLMEAFRLPAGKARVIVPDTGGGFGGKHTGEAAIEAARLAKAVGKPVSLRWTRQEELAWAYFRPAGVWDVRAGLAGGKIVAWDFACFNAGTAGMESPYAAPHARTQYFPCDSPLREGSYRGIAATGNNFARETFVDELAEAAGADPLAFRLDNLSDERLRNVLTAAAEAFGWERRRTGRGVGAGIAGGVEKGSYVAACVELAVEGEAIRIRRLVAAFECGAIQNPLNLRAQVEGALIQGLGGALLEEVRFAGGRLLNARLADYPVPRFADAPPMEVVLLDRPDLPSAGAGETPIIAVAPAIANAYQAATGVRARALPVRAKASS